MEETREHIKETREHIKETLAYIKNNRQERALDALLRNEAVTRKDLNAIAGALNAPETISQLRKQGFRGIILTRRFMVKDRDGKNCNPGEYYIEPAMKPFVARILQERRIQKDILRQHS